MTAAAIKPVSSLGLILLLATAMLLNYVDRGTVSIAAPLMMKDLDLSATQVGIAVSAFFWIYAPIQVLIGWLCDRLCVYRLFATGMAICAVSTALTGLVGGLVSLVALRVLLGIGESVAFPGCSKIIARNVPPSRRGIANSAVAAALATGPGVGTLAGGLIMAAYGWRAIFFVFAIVTLLWLIPWRKVSRTFISNGNAEGSTPFPLSRVVGVRALWAMSFGHFLGNIMLYFVMTWLPLYLVQARGLSITEMTLLATSVYVAQAISALIVGWWSDRLVAHGRDEGTIRKIFVVVGFTGVAAATLVTAYAATLPLLLACLIGLGAFQGFNGGNIFAIAQIFAGPRATGTWVGVQNSISNMAGIVGPVATGLIIDRAGGFTSAFVFTAAIGAIGAIWWCFALPKVRQIDI